LADTRQEAVFDGDNALDASLPVEEIARGPASINIL
jgi:hypothetical protein